MDDPAGAADAGASQTVRALLGLRQLLIDGELAPGTRISEPAMAARLGVSRTPVRAALLKLAEEGLLGALATGGYRVEGFTESDIADAIELRGTLEGLAARFAAERGVAPQVLADLGRCLDQIDEVLAGTITDEHFSRYVALNAQFHALLAEACDSSVVRRQLERAQHLPFASPNAFVRVQSSLPQSHQVLRIAQDQHRRIVEAIERREGARAEALAREHARIAHRNLQAALRNNEAMASLPGGRMIARRRSRS